MPYSGLFTNDNVILLLVVETPVEFEGFLFYLIWWGESSASSFFCYNNVCIGIFKWSDVLLTQQNSYSISH